MNKKMTVVIALVVLAAVGLSLYQGVNRHGADAAYNQVQLLLNFDNLEKLALTTNRSLEAVAKDFKEAGATGVLVKERSIKPAFAGANNSLIEGNDAVVYKGIDLVNQFSREEDTSNIRLDNQYLLVLDDGLRAQVQAHLLSKAGYCERVTLGGTEYLDIGVESKYVSEIGVGYPMAALEILAAEGLTVSPQVKDWVPLDPASVDFVIDDLRSIPQLNGIYFNDSAVPAYDDPRMQAFVKEEMGGFVEFFSKKQKGIETLLRATEDDGVMHMLRLHSINEAQMDRLSEKQSLDQIELAVNERNLRAVLIGMPTLGVPEEDYAFALDFIQKTKAMLEDDGFVITGEMQTFGVKALPNWAAWLIGLAAILVLWFIGERLDQRRLTVVIMAIGIVGYTGLLFLKPHIARQLMGIYASIVYPTLAMFIVVKETRQSVKKAIGDYFVLAGITLLGSLSVVGLMTSTTYTMGIDQFRGVKLVATIPLVLIIALLSLKYDKLTLQDIKTFLLKPVNYLIMGIAGAMAIALLFYVKRTGNGGSISSLELMFRQLLSDVLVVRPRTKEFMIGHPVTLLLLIWGFKKRYIPLVIIAMIGQASMVNTFAHLHTPILASIIRTVHGLWLGLVIGLIGYFVLEQIRKFLVRRELL